MGTFQRAVRYLWRKPSKTATLIGVIAVAVCMALLSLTIIDAIRGLSTVLKQAAVPEVVIYEENGQGIIDENLAARLGGLPCVDSTNRIGSVDAVPVGFSNIEGMKPDPGYDDAVRVRAYDDLSSGSPFCDGLVRLVEGAPIASNDEHAAIIHVDLAQANGLSLGDTIELEGAQGRRAQARIVGLYAAAGGIEGEVGDATARTQSFNQIYADNATAADLGGDGFTEVRLTLADPDRVDEAVAEIEGVCGEGVTVEVYDSALTLLSAPLDQTASAAQATLVLVSLTSVVVISALLALWGRSRMRERAILLALGHSRAEVVRQVLEESMILFVIGALAACLVSCLLAPVLVRALIPIEALQAAADAGTVVDGSIAAGNTITVAVIGLVVIAAATSICAIAALGRTPRELLTEKG